MKMLLLSLLIFACYGCSYSHGVSSAPETHSNKTTSGANNTLSNVGPSRVLTSVGSYLAIGGTADDTAAVQSVIATIPSGGGILNFQPGVTYSIGAAGINITGFTNLVVNFNGANFVALADTTHVLPGSSFRVAIAIVNCTNCKAYGGTFNGEKFSGGFIGLSNCTDCEIYRNTSSNVGRLGFGAAQFASVNSKRTQWHDNIAENAGAGGAVRGFWLGNVPTGQMETDLIVGPNNKAINNTATGFVISAVGAQVRSNYALNNAGSGFISPTSATGQSKDHVFVGNTSIGNSMHGYQTDVSDAIPVLGATITGNKFQGNQNDCLLLNYAVNFTVSANECLDNDKIANHAPAIQVLNSQQILITGNKILLNGTDGSAGISTAAQANTIDDLTIANNNIYSSNANATPLVIFAAGPSSRINRVEVKGNTISGGKGIIVRADTAGGVLGQVSIIGNSVTNSTSTAYQVLNAAAGQITGLKFVGNSGSPRSFDAKTMLVADSGNDWNTLSQPVGRK